MPEPETVRLNKHLALQLGISRREADDLIGRGQVTINGDTAVLGARFHPGDTISIRGDDVADNTAFEYITFNKPVGYVCSRRGQGDNPTIYAILPKEFHTLKPVGRLDKDSSGLILLSNDGDFAFRMTHPKFVKTKVYEVELDRNLEPFHQQMIGDFGVQLDDGTSKLGLTRFSDDNRKLWQVTMTEGRNRQIRRTFGALGYEVARLHRTHFGNYSLGDMKPGEYKTVNMR